MKRPRVFAALPTLLTLGNAACGFGAITIAAKVGPEPLPGIDETRLMTHLLIAGLLIFLAMVFDAFDGTAARWTGQTSEFGAQLDSLCDAISFGVAPAFLMLKLVQLDDYYHPRMLWVIAILFVMCALLRLARFNVETEEDDSHEFFSGLPSPAAAGTLASFPLALRGVRELAERLSARGAADAAAWVELAIPAMKLALPVIAFGVACLMVSRFRYPHIVNQVFRGQLARKHMLQLVFALAAAFLAREAFLLIFFCWYAFTSPAKALWVELAGSRLYNSPKT
jgi:CDP-diacylglycerol--serine O-phosphatidyltransferase